MKVTIMGNNPIISAQFKSVIADLNKAYTDLGIVEPMINEQQIERMFTF